MSRGIPDDILNEIKDRVFQEADRVNYLARNTSDNNIFISNLVTMVEVGGRLSQYISKTEVRTYIKDGILHRYSDAKAKTSRPSDLKKVIRNSMNDGVDFLKIETKDQIDLFKSSVQNYFIVIANGTVLKWETALRKALLYIVSMPLADQKDAKFSIILTLFARNQKVSPSDMRLLEKALRHCSATPYIYGEG